jgi:regulator of replication initiation timing
MATTQGNAKNPGLGGQMLAQREKYWSEIKADEKIERLRTLLKSMVSENNRLRSELNKIKRHTHDESGKAVTIKPLSEEYGEDSQIGAGIYKTASGNPDDTYI